MERRWNRDWWGHLTLISKRRNELSVAKEEENYDRKKIIVDKNISHFLPYTGGFESFIFKHLKFLPGPMNKLFYDRKK